MHTLCFNTSSRSSRMKALANPARIGLEVVRVWEVFGERVVRPAQRGQGCVLSGQLVRIKGMGDRARPMRFEYAENGIAYFTTGSLDELLG